MDLRGFTDLGADIGRRVTQSVNSGDFSRLNRDIRRTIEDAFMNPVRDPLRDPLNGKLYREEEHENRGFDRVYNEQTQQAPHQPQNTAAYAAPKVPVGGKLPGKGGSIAMMITGYLIAGVFGITGIGLALMMIPANAYDPSTLPIFGASAGFMVPFTAGGLVLGIAGTKRYGIAKRFWLYVQMLAQNSFCQIKQLASRVGKNEKFVAKDLTKMIEKGYFPEGHLDDQKTCFIGDDETYRQYVAARDSAAKAAAEPELSGAQSGDAMQQVINEGKAYIKTIREANDAIYDPVISEKLFRMEVIVQKIFEYVKANQDQVGQLRKFMSYYMPTTEKLVRAYQKMDEETVLGKNMTRAKEEIAQTLDTINEAYEKLYDSMHIDIAMDVSSDIAVLKTMFAQEGLSKDELGGKKDE